MKTEAEELKIGLEKLKAAIVKNRRLVLEAQVLLRQLDESLAASKEKRARNDAGLTDAR